MDSSYELWDIDTGTAIGEFGSVEEAFEIVLALLDAYGARYAQELLLLGREPGAEARAVASGEDLQRLAKRTAQDRARAEPAQARFD